MNGIDPKQISQMLQSYGINQNGKADLDKLVNFIFSHYGETDTNLKNEMKSIFETYAQKDGNAELSAEEYIAAIDSEGARAIVSKIAEKKMELFKNAKPIVETPLYNSSGEIVQESMRDAVVREKGETFANEVSDPLQKMLEDALEYAANHNGETEGFSFTGPQDVEILTAAPLIDYGDPSNDVMQVVNGHPQTIRNADAARMFLIFKYEGKTYSMNSQAVKTDLTPWGNPSHIEE